MNRKTTYRDCLNFIENQLHIRLLDFQKEYIKACFENRMIVGGRGTGKTMCRNAYNKYIDSLIIDEEHPDEAYANN